MTSRGALVVIGIGPGIGRAVTTKFASEGFNHIFVVSRSAERLEQEKAAVLKETSNKEVKIEAITADIGDPKSLEAALKKIDDSGEVVESVYFNAAKVAPAKILEYPVEDMDREWKVSNIALYQVAQWLIPRLQKHGKSLKHPSLLVTNSHLWKLPAAPVFSLSMTKASQRILVQCLNQTYAPEGIHCALISVSGAVSPENKVLNPKNIADEAWTFFDSAKPDALEIELWEDERPTTGH